MPIASVLEIDEVIDPRGDPPLDRWAWVRARARTPPSPQAFLHRCLVGFRKRLSGDDGDDADVFADASPVSAPIESIAAWIPEAAADSPGNS